MADIRSIDPQEFNAKLANALKEFDELKKPIWLDFVKSGTSKVRPIADVEFWHKRAASILKQAYVRKVIGVNRLRTRYGGRKDRGMQPPEFRPSSGKIIRLILQQSEKAGLLEKSKSKKAGRQLTLKGKQLLESIK